MCQTIKSVKGNSHLFFSLKLWTDLFGSKLSEFIVPSSASKQSYPCNCGEISNQALALSTISSVLCLNKSLGWFRLAFSVFGLLLRVDWVLTFMTLNGCEKSLIQVQLENITGNICLFSFKSIKREVNPQIKPSISDENCNLR